MTDNLEEKSNPFSFLAPVILAAIAGGMAWGIRGQYGHETGAMMSGCLVSLALILTLKIEGTPLQLARAVALTTLASGLGGSMTYGQTLGLTQNPDLIGNNAAWAWGILGCAIKGGAWIGLFGAFMGIGFGGKRYQPYEMAAIMIGMVVLYYLGVSTINSPFVPEEKILPALYFSASWDWQPDVVDLKPRPENWGGLWVALAGLVMYLGSVKRDGLAARMATWGIIGGALGFPLGQSIQSYAAWHRDALNESFIGAMVPYVNWWNMMEITFGTVAGAVLGLGLWFHQRRINFDNDDAEARPGLTALEVAILMFHFVLVACVDFISVDIIDFFYDLGLIMVIIPMTLAVRGRISPFLIVTFVLWMPIAGKTLRSVAYRDEPMLGMIPSWIVYVIIPLTIGLAYAVYSFTRQSTNKEGSAYAFKTFLLCSWCFFLLNWAIFDYPWPWMEWTGRTHSGIIYIVCIVALTAYAIYDKVRSEPQSES